MMLTIYTCTCVCVCIFPYPCTYTVHCTLYHNIMQIDFFCCIKKVFFFKLLDSISIHDIIIINPSMYIIQGYTCPHYTGLYTCTCMYNITLYSVIHLCTILHYTGLYMHIQYYIIQGYTCTCTCTCSSLLVCVCSIPLDPLTCTCRCCIISLHFD